MNGSSSTNHDDASPPTSVPHTLYFAAPPIDGPQIINILSFPSATSPPYLVIKPLSISGQSFVVQSPENSSFLFKFVLEDDIYTTNTYSVTSRVNTRMSNTVDVFSPSHKVHSLRVSDGVVFRNPFQPDRMYRWSLMDNTATPIFLLDRTSPLSERSGSLFAKNLDFEEVVATFELTKIPFRFKEEQNNIVRIMSKLSPVFEHPEDVEFDANAKWRSLEECAFMAGVANVAANQAGFLKFARLHARNRQSASVNALRVMRF